MNSARGPGAIAPPGPRALVLLGGSVRPTNFLRAIGRSPLDLPVAPDLSVLQLWESHAQRLAQAAGLDELPVRVVLDHAAPEPTRNGAGGRIRLLLERETAELRGTGGILRDLAVEYGPDDLLLVAGAGQILIEPLAALASDLIGTRAGVALIGHEDRTPGAVFLVSCRVLTRLPGVGFLDFKEQVLPRLAAAGTPVRAVRRGGITAFGVRSLEGYLAGLRAYHRAAGGKAVSDPFADDWSPTFSVVEAGAAVGPGATIHDSVVLGGGRVERGATVVRSVVCPGGVVRAGHTVAGQVVAPERPSRVPR